MIVAAIIGGVIYPATGMFVANRFVTRSYEVPSVSMEPTVSEGDRILVDMLRYRFTDPDRSDIVVFSGPDSWGGGNADFIKRVIAVEGDTVMCCDSQNRLLLNGKPLDEPYVLDDPAHLQISFGPVTVPDGRVWVMGDNRNNSADSRRHIGDANQGTVDVDDVKGRASLRLWPISRFGRLD